MIFLRARNPGLWTAAGAGAGTAIGTALASSAYIVGTTAQMPPHVAMHFSSAGQGTAAVSRDFSLLLTLGFAVLLPLFIVASIAGLPLITKRGVKLPNRDYWL